MSNHVKLGIIALFCALIGSANASTVLYNNGSPNQADAADISEFIAADDFSLITKSTIKSATFFASADVDPFLSQFSGTVGWGLYANDAGVPGALLTSGSDTKPTAIDTGIQIFGTEEYEITFDLSATLKAGSYWLGLHEGPFGSPDDGTPIYWDSTGSQTGSLPMSTSTLSGVGGWTQALPEPNLDLAFKLYGTPDTASATPEPCMQLPVLLVLAIVANAARKRVLTAP